MKKILFALLFLSLPLSTHAADYTVDYAASKIGFSGTHIDKPFSGDFSAWQAEISFDPADPGKGKITATLQSASAKTGNAMYDGTLPQADWLDTAKFPQIVFTSHTIRQNADKSYTASGDLNLRGVMHPVDLVFTLSDPAVAPVTAKGHFTIDRLAYEIGKGSDTKAEWVGKEIVIAIDIVATPKG